ncbi:MAG: hypothetical protein LBE67_13385 [Kocuria palustris]|jgi:hypothetical protein|nr:hypothetical protein [Kocuria palustris]
MQITKPTLAPSGRSGKKCGARRSANRGRSRKRKNVSGMKNARRSVNSNDRKMRKTGPDERKLMSRGELIVNANAKSSGFLMSSENENGMKDMSDAGEKIGSDIEAGTATVTAVELETETVSVIALRPIVLTVAYPLGPGIQNMRSHLRLMLPLLC